MLYAIQEGKSYVLKFKYDPVLINYVKMFLAVNGIQRKSE